MKALFDRSLNRIRNLPDSARVTVQSTAGAVATFVITTIAGVDATGWAVMTTLFVVQGTMDSTFSTALWRVVGAVIGSAIGLACVLAIGTGGLLTAASLAAGVLAMSLVILWLPSTSFGLVTVVVLVVSPGFEVVDNAIEKTIAIGVGAGVGILIAGLLFRKSSANAAIANVKSALRRSAELTREAPEALLDGERPGLREQHDAIAQEIADTRAKLSETRYDFIRRGSRLIGLRRGQRTIGENAIASVDAVWRSLSVLRTTAETLPSVAAERLGDPVRRMSDAIAGRLEQLADVFAAGEAPTESRGLHDALSALRDQADAFRSADLARLSVEETAQTFAALHAFIDLGNQTELLARDLGAPTARPSDATRHTSINAPAEAGA